LGEVDGDREGYGFGHRGPGIRRCRIVRFPVQGRSAGAGDGLRALRLHEGRRVRRPGVGRPGPRRRIPDLPQRTPDPTLGTHATRSGSTRPRKTWTRRWPSPASPRAPPSTSAAASRGFLVAVCRPIVILVYPSAWRTLLEGEEP
jgi:hypothetical protein